MQSNAAQALHIGAPGEAATVVLDDDTVLISGLVVDDPAVVGLVSSTPGSERVGVVLRALAVGARGLASMGMGLDVAAIGDQVRSSVQALTDEAERRIEALLEAGRRTITEHLDPEHRSSTMARALSEFQEWRDALLGSLDPAVEGSHVTAFLDRLTALVGPGGTLETRLQEALDPDADGSALGRLASGVEARLDEMRDLIVRQSGIEEGRAVEATRGTAQGTEFEDVVERRLRAWAAGLGGCQVERTARSPGDLGSNATVGDFVVALADGTRIVVEAKNQASIGLAGETGILAELDRAMANRGAEIAVCISSRSAFPAEVGEFGVYGTRILAVDDGEGTLLGVALRWAAGLAAARQGPRAPHMDSALVEDRLERIRKLAETFKSARRTLTEVRKSVNGVHETLGWLREEILELVGDLDRELHAHPDPT